MTATNERVPGTWAVVVSLLLAVLAAVYLLWAPVYGTVSTGVGTGPGAAAVERSTTDGATLIEVNGWAALMAIAAPVILSAMPLVANRRRSALAVRAVSSVLLLGFAVLAGFSIGLFYLPSALAMFASVVWLGWGEWRRSQAGSRLQASETLGSPAQPNRGSDGA